MSGLAAPRVKPRALTPGSQLSVFAPASPADSLKLVAGMAELKRLGFEAKSYQVLVSEEYFAGTTVERRDGFLRAITADSVEGLVAVRGGYGSNYLLGENLAASLRFPKVVIGFSDLTSLQVYLWQHRGWVTIHGPMVAAGLDAGADVRGGYDEESFLAAVSKTDSGWTIPLKGETIRNGEAEGTLLGGCMTLVETTLGTPWELDTRGAILVLEDRGMKPWQVDRALMHLKQAGKLDGLRGLVLGEFPECEAPIAGSPTVRDVCTRILAPLGVPIVFGAPIGHTPRAMLTVPLGVKVRLIAMGEGVLDILEPAVVHD
jgi:muramoyltetrapeptide carboxypeptidase